MEWIVYAILIAYLALIMGIGIISARRVRSTTDYLVAGRKASTTVVAGTLAATSIGGGSTLGAVGNTYSKWGVSAFWYVAAMGIALILLSFLAPVLRRTKARTVPEYFRKRYGKGAGFLTAVLNIISMIGIVAVQLKASATVLEVMADMDYNTALLIVAAIICIYSMVGGFWSVALTDVIQLVVIFAGMMIAVPYALNMSGGWLQTLSFVPNKTLSISAGIGGWGEILSYILLFTISYAVGEEVASGYYAAENEASARRGSFISGVIVVIFAVIPVILGILMLSMYNQGILSTGVREALNQDAKFALPALAVASMPVLVVGILFAGIISATMSTADSALLGAGSMYANDIYRVFLNPEAESGMTLATARVSMVFFMVAAITTAIYAGNILTILAVSFALRAAGSFVPYFLGLLWKRGNTLGCILSLFCGTAVYAAGVWTGWFRVSSASAILPALTVSFIVFVIGSFVPKLKKRR